MTKNIKKEPSQPLILTLMQSVFQLGGKIAPAWFGNYAYHLWFQPSRFPIPDRERDLIKSAHIMKKCYSNVAIRVWSWGHGPTILIMHGWAGRGTQLSAIINKLVDLGHRVISFDGPAHGESFGKSTDIIKYANITKEIINEYGPIHGVITHSFGAMVFCLAYESGMPLNKVIFICPPATLHTPVNHFKNFLHISDKSLKTFVANLKRDYGDDIYDTVCVLQNSKKISKPVLIIHDKDDQVVPLQDGKDIADGLEHASFYQTEELGHRRLLHDESVLNKIIDFFALS